jgi:hypothetical protein
MLVFFDDHFHTGQRKGKKHPSMKVMPRPDPIINLLGGDGWASGLSESRTIRL